jgi:hypothetical protein
MLARFTRVRLLVRDLARAHGTATSVGDAIADEIIQEIEAVCHHLAGDGTVEHEASGWYVDPDEDDAGIP